jgi:hypothetical protein
VRAVPFRSLRSTGIGRAQLQILSVMRPEPESAAAVGRTIVLIGASRALQARKVAPDRRDD